MDNSRPQIEFGLLGRFGKEPQDLILSSRQLGLAFCPTLLLAGDADFLASRSSLDAICKLIPRARIEILDFAGHIPYFEATTAFEYAVQNLINEIEAEG